MQDGFDPLQQRPFQRLQFPTISGDGLVEHGQCLPVGGCSVPQFGQGLDGPIRIGLNDAGLLPNDPAQGIGKKKSLFACRIQGDTILR
jgi:hypothetical protein